MNWPLTTHWMTGVRTFAFDEYVATHPLFPVGLLIQPLTGEYVFGGSIYRYAAVDNGCFTQAGRDRFTWRNYARLILDAQDVWKNRLMFATARDIPCDWAGTLKLSLPMLDQIRGLGVPAAVVAQNGATTDNMPWDRIDAVFLGGDDAWKEGPEARAITTEANERGLHTHMGRVNTTARMRIANEFGCNTADGTHLKFHAQDVGLRHVLDWLRGLHAEAVMGLEGEQRHRAIYQCCSKCGNTFDPLIDPNDLNCLCDIPESFWRTIKCSVA